MITILWVNASVNMVGFLLYDHDNYGWRPYLTFAIRYITFDSTVLQVTNEERIYNIYIYIYILVDPGGPVVIILASGSEVRGFDPGRGRWIFSERKNPEDL